MNTNEQGAMELQQFEQGLKVLKRRKRNLSALAVLVASIGVASLVSVFFQQELIFNMFGVAQNIQQIHIPYIVDDQLREYINKPDYLMNALSWFGWLILKLVVSFIGAFVVVGFLKKIRFFLIRFQSFILKFVAWLIAFIVLWSGLTYMQYEMRDDENSEIASLIQYDKSVQQSDIYQYLQKSDTPETVQSYLLAQTALMHKPTDQVVATVYADKLVKAEQLDSHFLEYGFKPEQLWTIQHQVFNQAVSPIAKSVESKVTKATFWSSIVEKVFWFITFLSFVFSFFVYWIAHRMGKRLERISVNTY